MLTSSLNKNAKIEAVQKKMGNVKDGYDMIVFCHHIVPNSAIVIGSEILSQSRVPVYALLGVHVKMCTYKNFRPKLENKQPNFLS